jgi:predicted transcriptional regulator
MEIGRQLEREGLIKLEGESAVATPALMAQAGKFEADMQAALDELEKKHAFERG